MKQKTAIISSVLAITLVFAAFFVGRASATTGCFSDANGHWAETFICWLKDNGISTGYPDGTYHPDSPITRAEMAVMLQKIDNLAVAQDNLALSTGDTYISVGPANWVVGPGSGTIQYAMDSIKLNSSTIGNKSFLVQPMLPTSLYNHQMYLKGVKLCYQTFPNASITIVTLWHTTNNSSSSLTDNTIRNDLVMTCREYDWVTPRPLKGTDIVTLDINVNLTSLGGYVYIMGTTFILSPSASTGVLGASPADSGLNP